MIWTDDPLNLYLAVLVIFAFGCWCGVGGTVFYYGRTYDLKRKS
jgi:hypothetical protein